VKRVSIILSLSFLLAGCFGSLPPDIGVDELPESQPYYPEYSEGEAEWDNSREREEYDAKCDAVFDYEIGDWVQPASCRDGSSKTTNIEESSKCPNGCTSRKSGCDIKGNISFNSKEKIYHVPGQNFYNDTKISPQYGERWFCTEAEARANGWRKAKN
jgi:hypothetical protein